LGIYLDELKFLTKTQVVGICNILQLTKRKTYKKNECFYLSKFVGSKTIIIPLLLILHFWQGLWEQLVYVPGDMAGIPKMAFHSSVWHFS
jgi:hypothetical protein